MSFENNNKCDTSGDTVAGVRSVALALTLVLSGTAFPPFVQGTEAETGHPVHAMQHDMAKCGSAHETGVHDHAAPGPGESDPHAHHRQMLKSKGYSSSVHEYDLPDLTLVDMNGDTTSLLKEVNADRPVMLNFIFTTCTTICPVLSATFAQVQQELGEARDRVHMISITIDPAHDTPARLHAYAARFNAGAQWQFLTGDPNTIVAVQKAFHAYRGSKANHEPLTFLRGSVGAPWVRIEGLASAADVIEEYQKLVRD
mgnify:CR=1 FL=1